MAELKVPNVFTIFPVGTTVGVYTVVVSDAGHPQPIGDAIESAVVAEDGSLTFTTLTLDGTKYYAAAKVSGEWRVMNLVTSEPTDADTSAALADHEADTTAVHGVADTSTLALKSELDGAGAELKEVIAASGMGYVNHGATASTARPEGYAAITWVGSVEPENMVEGDIWIEVP